VETPIWTSACPLTTEQRENVNNNNSLLLEGHTSQVQVKIKYAQLFIDLVVLLISKSNTNQAFSSISSLKFVHTCTSKQNTQGVLRLYQYHNWVTQNFHQTFIVIRVDHQEIYTAFMQLEGLSQSLQSPLNQSPVHTLIHNLPKINVILSFGLRLPQRFMSHYK
jgi:hypothetical protein